MIQNSLFQLRARVGTNEKGKHFFDVSMWDGPYKQIGLAIGPFGPYDTEAEAAQDSVKAIKATVYILSQWKVTLSSSMYYEEACKALKRWKTYVTSAH